MKNLLTNSKNVSAIFLLSTFVLIPLHGFSENWAQFRGKGGAGIAENPDQIPTEWSATKNLLWKTDLPGKGSSSPIIWGNRIFLTSSSGFGESRENPGNQADLERHLICLDKETGRILWTKTHQATHLTRYTGHGFASHTPVTDGKAVYVFYNKEGALAYDFEGRQLWHFTGGGTGIGSHGSGGALALFEDILLVNASAESKSFFGLNKSTGEKIWRTEDIVECYNTPTVIDNVVLAVSKDQTVGLDARTGIQKWKGFGPSRYICNSPAVINDIAYLTCGWDGPTKAIRADGTELWSLQTRITVPSPAVVDGLLFGVSGDIVTCADAKTGDEVFRTRMGVTITKDVYASPLVVGDKLFVVTRRDGTVVLSAGRSLEVIAQNRIAGDDSFWNASPAVSDGRLFLRSEKALYCIGR